MNTLRARPEPKGGLRRRDVFALFSTLALTPWFSDLAFAQSLLTDAAVARPLPAGFLDGSREVPDLRDLASWLRQPVLAQGARWEDGSSLRIMPAAELFQGDTELIGRPLRLRIDGLYPPAALVQKRWKELPLSIDLDLLFPSPDPAFSKEPLRFQAWSFRRKAGWNPSPPIRFNFPLDWQVLPVIEMRIVPAGGAAPVTLRTGFTFDDEPGVPRLQRGVYLLGTQPNAWRSPVDIATLARRAPAELVSVLMSIEPAEVPAE